MSKATNGICISSLDPQLVKDLEMVENVQRRATRMVPEIKELNYEERLRKMKLSTLAYERARGNKSNRDLQDAHWEL